MKIKGQLMDAEDMRNTFRRMAHQIVEQDGAEDLVLIGIRTRGVTVAKRLKACIDAVEGTDLPLGVFDITLYRDDLEDLASEVCFAGSEVNFAVDGKTVVLCDDVIYTGRTVRAALSEVMALGRPARIRFAALVDRGHRELPFKPDYTGKNVPTSRREGIAVGFGGAGGEDAALIYDKE